MTVEQKPTIHLNLNEMLDMVKHVTRCADRCQEAAIEMELAKKSLTKAMLHDPGDFLTCNHCGYSGPEGEEKPLPECPSCTSTSVKFKQSKK